MVMVTSLSSGWAASSFSSPLMPLNWP